jgi:hypothetical protein
MKQADIGSSKKAERGALVASTPTNNKNFHIFEDVKDSPLRDGQLSLSFFFSFFRVEATRASAFHIFDGIE